MTADRMTEEEARHKARLFDEMAAGVLAGFPDIIRSEWRERAILLAENERLREALGACAGFLNALRDDDSEYDFTLAQYEHIGRLCQLAFRAITPSPTKEPTDDH